MQETEQLTLQNVCKVLNETVETIDEVLKEEYTEADRWLVIVDTLSIIYNLIVLKTSLELYNWNRLHKYYQNADMTSHHWLILQRAYIKLYLTNLES